MFWSKRGNLAEIPAVALLTALILISLPTGLVRELEYEVDSMEVTVYRDGCVHVTQALTVNETFPSVSFRLLAPIVENILVLDENQTFLDYEIDPSDASDITVFSLGAKKVLLEYDSTSLTKKEAEVWTLIFDSLYDLTVCLPEESTIIFLNELPTSIDTLNGKTVLSLFPGRWEISYVLPVLIPASFTITDLTVEPAQVDVGDDVTVSATVTNVGEAEGSHTVVLEINGAVAGTEAVTLAGGASTVVEFRVTRAYAGTYRVEVGELESEFSVKEPVPFPIEYLIAVIVLAIVGGAGGFIFLRRSPAKAEKILDFLRRRPVKAEKIFEERPELRQEDREVIQFIAERGGKALEAEIREAFPDLPRTTLWRLVRRLEKMEIVSIKKVGLQNQVELKK